MKVLSTILVYLDSFRNIRYRFCKIAFMLKYLSMILELLNWFELDKKTILKLLLDFFTQKNPNTNYLKNVKRLQGVRWTTLARRYYWCKPKNSFHVFSVFFIIETVLENVPNFVSLNRFQNSFYMPDQRLKTISKIPLKWAIV